MSKFRVLAAIGIASILVGCGSDPSPVTTTVAPESTDVPTDGGTQAPVTTAETPPADTTQIANPASVFCIEQGGTLEIVDEADGQVGYCTLPDGTRVEEWEYYRSQNPDMSGEELELPDE